MASSKKNKKLGVGVIGVGSIGPYHVQGYTEHPDCEVVAICDINLARGNAVANKFGVKTVVAEYKKMLAMDAVEAVSVCVPNYLHAEMTIAAFQAGKHVVCEKPLATSPKEGEAMVAASKKAGKLFMTAFNNRFRGDTQVLKKFIDNGELGDIYYAKTGWIRRKGIPGMGGWFTTKAKSGGGPLLDIGCHVLDLTLWLMGNPKAVTVSGSTYAMFGPKGEGMGGWGTAEKGGSCDVEDLACGLIRFDNGATVFVEASWASHIEKDVFYSNLMGTKGGADVEPFRVYKDMHGTTVDITPGFPEQEGHITEVKHFVDCVTKNQPLVATGQHGLDIIRILDALYRSAASGKEISLK